MGQALTSTSFYLHGTKHSTKTGYLNHVKTYSTPVQTQVYVPPSAAEQSDGVDLSGKVVIITGSNSGIGKTIATYCYGKQAKVYMFCRSKERAEAARQEIIETCKPSTALNPENLKIVECDVSLLSSVKAAVSEFEKVEPQPLHALVCNAGVLLNEKTLTSEGLETTFASHLLGGSYLLSTLLKDKLAPDSSRVVYVSSGGMYNSKLPKMSIMDGSHPTYKYDGNMAYVFAKRGQLLLAQHQTDEKSHFSLSCHPGWVDTPAVEEAYGANKKWLEPMRNVWEGAEGICHLVSAPRSELVGGAFYLDRVVQPKHLTWFGRGTVNTEEEIRVGMEGLAELCKKIGGGIGEKKA
jgi:dehydrogenase/reductase SDR family protein 12